MHDLLKKSVAARCLTPLASGLCVLLLAGCGQKGPLTLPPANAAASAAAASAPAR